LYFCTSKASKLSDEGLFFPLACASRQVDDAVGGQAPAHRLYLMVSQHLYALNVLAERVLSLLRYYFVF
jgi:hypothetical protein